LLKSLMADQVVDAAIADARVSGLEQVRHAVDPRARVREMITLYRMFSVPEHGLYVFALSAAEVVDAGTTASASLYPDLRSLNEAVATAMLLKGPPGIWLMGRPSAALGSRKLLRRGPLDRPWRVAVVYAQGLTASVALLFVPFRGRRRSPGFRLRMGPARSLPAPIVALSEAVAVADHGAEATTSMIPRRGRSSYLGDRALGRPDPGAVAVATWLRAVCRSLEATD
jgi:hypothetical protein